MSDNPNFLEKELLYSAKKMSLPTCFWCVWTRKALLHEEKYLKVTRLRNLVVDACDGTIYILKNYKLCQSVIDLLDVAEIEAI